MKTIEVDDEVFQALEAHARGFGDSPNQVIRRLIEGESVTKGRAEVSNFAGPIHQVNASPITQLINSQDFLREDGKGRYKQLLKFLHDQHPEELKKFVGYRRGSRVNFALDSQSIEESGSSTMPELIEGTPYYVLTNLSHKRKREILGDILQGLRYTPEVIAIILKTIPDSGISRRKRIDISAYV